MNSSLWSAVGIVALGFAGSVAACKSDKPADNPNAFSGQGGYGNAGYGGYANNGYAGGYNNPPPPTTGPTATATAPAGPPNLVDMINGFIATGTATLGAMAPAGSDPIDFGLKGLAQQQAPGMKAEGQPIKVNLQPGAHGEGTVTLAPGKCYTILAIGMLGVQQVAIRLMPPAPLPPQVLFEGVTNGPTAVIGPKEQCIHSPSPLPAPLKVDIQMMAGQGQVGVQAYSK